MARKQVTIPLGFDTDNIDIGNKNQVSGLNWEFWYAYVGDVRNTLSENNYNLGKLCKSTNINKWAAYKPNRHGVSEEPWEYTGLAVDNVTKEIVYERPTNVSGYWIDHFLGYNHNATEPKINVADNYYYLDGGEEKEKQFAETMIVTLPEFDIRTGVRNGQITHWTTKVTCKLNSGDKVTETHEEIIDDEVSAKSLNASFKIYETDDASYEIDIEVWFGTTTDYEIFKHPDSPKSTTATKQTEYQLSVISENMDYQADFSNATVNNTTGAYSFNLVITDGNSNQRGGTARKNVYVGAVLTDIGQANFSTSEAITNSDTELPEDLLPLTNDVVIILNGFSVDPL